MRSTIGYKSFRTNSQICWFGYTIKVVINNALSLFAFGEISESFYYKNHYQTSLISISYIGGMKQVAFLLLLSFCALNAKAQDVIVINSGDTIICNIISVETTGLLYKELDSNETKLMPKEVVVSYEIHLDEFIPTEVELPTFKKTPKVKRSKNRDKGAKFGLGAGYTYMLAPISSNTPKSLESYARNTKSGYNIKVNVSHFFGRYFGLGVKYSFVQLKGEMEINQAWWQILYKHNIKMHFAGAHFTSRFSSKKKGVRFLPGISVGFIEYNSKMQSATTNHFNARTFGLGVDFGLDLKLHRSLYFALGLDFMVAFLNENSYYGSQTGGNNNLTRMDVSGGLRYYLNYNSISRPTEYFVN